MAFENLKSTGIKYLLGKLKDVFVQIKNAVRTVNGNEPDANGDVHVNSVPYAENLISDSTQTSHGSFVMRTSGGTASIETGDAWLMDIKGNSIHDGFVAEVLTHEESEGLTVTIDRDTFVSYVSQSGTITLTYTTEWSANPALYGVTVTGTPTSGNTIAITYVKEERGIIYQSNPSAFRSVRWNLYNYNDGYAHVVKYSNEYAFRVEGTYTALQYSATLNGTKYALTVNDGNFDPFANNELEEAYVWVTGGNSSDTVIYMTWGDWTEEANDGVFAAYDEDSIDLSGLFGDEKPLPYGLCNVGSVSDEVNLNLGTVTKRVERMAYNSENLATAKASGREYEYDTNYIYLALAEPVITTVEIDGSFTADDHGIEIFDGTDIPVTVQILYGNNLRNKLERDVLTISQQTLTAGQKAQVQTNIGARVYNDLDKTQTETGFALDARQGKTLNDSITTLDGIASKYIRKVQATSGQTITIAVPEKCPFMLLLARSNNSANTSIGLYAGQANTNGSIIPIFEPTVASKPTVAISGQTITITTSYANTTAAVVYFPEYSNA